VKLVLRNQLPSQEVEAFGGDVIVPAWDLGGVHGELVSLTPGQIQSDCQVTKCCPGLIKSGWI
jgi:hypothetical protein